MKTRSALLILFVSCLSLNLRAQSANDASDLQRKIDQSERFCPRLNCPDQPAFVVTMSSDELQTLGSDGKAALKAQVQGLVQDQWPEMLTKANLKNLNRLRIDLIQKLVVDGQDAGYRVSYSDKAWDLSQCSYDPNDASTLNSCPTGRIEEAAFVSLSPDLAFPDAQARASFVPGAQ